MGKNVYDQLLKRYTDLRSAYLKRERDAKTGIEQAKSALESNSAKMAEAIANEDQASYVRLSGENDKHEKAIAYYTELLNKIQAEERDDSAYDHDEVNDLVQTVRSESARLASEYEKKIRELADEMQALSDEVRIQYGLLKIARNKIYANLAHKTYQDNNRTAYEAMPALGAFDVFSRNLNKNYLINRDQEAEKVLSGECEKWI